MLIPTKLTSLRCISPISLLKFKNKRPIQLNSLMQMRRIMEADESHPFYGHDILRDQQEQYIRDILRKYKGEKVSEELKQRIWDELQHEKYQGRITIPFKVVTRRDSRGKYPEYIEVILDTKL